MATAKKPLAPVALIGSKPDYVPALRTTWRASAEHAAEQGKRFLRLLVVSAIPVIVSAVTAATVSGQHFDPKTLLALLVPVAETAYRQVFPALGAAAADSAPGVTIVPADLQQPVTDIPDTGGTVATGPTQGDAAP